MKLRLAVSVALLAAVLLGQQPQRRERPVRLASRGTHGAVAGGIGIRHRGRHAHVSTTAATRWTPASPPCSPPAWSSSRTSDSAAKPPSSSAPRTAKCTPSPVSAPCPNSPPPSSSATTKLTDEEMVSPPEAGGMKNWVPGRRNSARARARHGGSRARHPARVRHQIVRRSRAAGHRTGRRLSHRRNARQRHRQQREVSGGVAR